MAVLMIQIDIIEINDKSRNVRNIKKADIRYWESKMVKKKTNRYNVSIKECQ